MRVYIVERVSDIGGRTVIGVFKKLVDAKNLVVVEKSYETKFKFCYCIEEWKVDDYCFQGGSHD